MAAMPWYVKAVGNTRTVGPHIAQTMRWLESVGAFDLRRLHVVGFSLGAEIAGFMGKALYPLKVIIFFLFSFGILSKKKNYGDIYL